MKDYIKLALVTESTSWHKPNERLLHAALGIMTEVIEVGASDCLEEVKEEIGDLCWYLAIACDELGITFDDLEAEEGDGLTEPFDGLILKAGEFLDMQKKSIFYGRVYQKIVMVTTLSELFMFLMRELETWDWRLDEIQAENIDKLRKRYGEKFTEAAALNR